MLIRIAFTSSMVELFKVARQGDLFRMSESPEFTVEVFSVLPSRQAWESSAKLSSTVLEQILNVCPVMFQTDFKVGAVSAWRAPVWLDDCLVI
ncbi:hypothetical protein [Pseudomonas denitrificans (nom. rej.)]|uniref:Uncharacterized protein n=1 Tax=Pseudomonas denitrificans TaxID=43306 RepID=A0A9X7N1S8_PSEDE|nr:hypothetical protein [Pseudomonas denitrificans (nom. rej.)]QEY73335.1 hypothetical protein F1C79_17945 [Pseudomonas denitrificans (nom. rej.)]